MSFLRRTATLSTVNDLIRREYGTNSGQVITPEKALRHSTVWASLSSIAEVYAELPVEEAVQRQGSTVRRQPPKLFFEPVAGMPWETWIWQQAWQLASRGRCYGYITGMDANGWPTQVVPVPDEVVRWRYVQGENQWVTFVEQEEVKRWPLGPLWHCPLYSLPGRPEGLSPIAFHAESIGVGLAAQEFGARFFGDGGHPTMVAKSEKDPGPAGAKALKDLVMGVINGSREPIVLPKGVTLERWQVAPNESQFLDTMRYSGEDVCRIFGVPPGKVGLAVSGQNVTYTNTELANADWRVSGLARYTAALEAHLTRLVPAGPNRQIRFNYNGFLRADSAGRAAMYKVFAEIGQISGTPVMLTNEMRAEEGLAPLPGGETFARVPPQQNTQTREAESA